MIIRELTADESSLAFDAMRALRTALTREEFVRRVREQARDGYRLVAAFDDATTTVFAVAGFRFADNLAWGRHCYIDDLSTVPAARGRGAASRLLAWIADEAGRAGVTQVHLDSGVQAERQDAHRLYFRTGFRISSYHFSRVV
ncbi:GNAT family N-acetyltransferase [Curtobacterium sp. ISL-83]|uniref:GNAT family N-acetyltransferase n=1 Tax=Curtobacterium sp. ISL-83 TaxID=2819145 RepID=UPI001BEC9936|nr:GNAT family N-acetyltransferase [Curtobacterium sp. ISL-83]MBT2504243.1 GNAT family N-acetyltransferase [Curtobacterium sp. ISL-83]